LCHFRVPDNTASSFREYGKGKVPESLSQKTTACR
jgi:hypothetical protein